MKKFLIWHALFLVGVITLLFGCGGGGSASSASSGASISTEQAIAQVPGSVTIQRIQTAPIVSTDVLTWLDSKLPADQFVGYAGQVRSSEGAWSRFPITGVDLSTGGATHLYQPFRSQVDRAQQRVYWRKDDASNLANSWYGELWYYDSENVMLHAETAPWPQFSADAWDARADRFRLFHQINNPSKGRVLAPLQVDSTWIYQQSSNTELCGLSSLSSAAAQRVDGFAQVNSGTCPRYQSGVVDQSVTLQVLYNFDFHDQAGMQTELASLQMPQDAEQVALAPQVWEAVLVINQVMRDGTGGVARERFFMGYHKGVYYGLVGWDNASGATLEQLKVTERAVPEAILRRVSGPMDFLGMAQRSSADHSLPAPQTKSE